MLVRFRPKERTVIDYIFRVELTSFANDACCRLPKRKATTTSENFIVAVYVRYKRI